MTRGRAWIGKVSVLTAVVLSAGALAAWEFHRGATPFSSSDGAPLRDYGVVWEHKLTRSGMPRDNSGWQWLRGRGTRSIVTFRTENDVDYEKLGFERVLRIPLRGGRFPSDEQVDAFLRFVQDPGNWPVHIHCSAGKDRTGMMAALVRYAIDGWPIDQALAEARSYRGGKDLGSERIEWLKSWAARHKPGSYRTGG